jgi:hypothetical protein
MSPQAMLARLFKQLALYNKIKGRAPVCHHHKPLTWFSFVRSTATWWQCTCTEGGYEVRNLINKFSTSASTPPPKKILS